MKLLWVTVVRAADKLQSYRKKKGIKKNKIKVMTGHQRDRAEDDVVCSLQLHFTQSPHTPYCEYFESLFQQQTIQAL